MNSPENPYSAENPSPQLVTMEMIAQKAGLSRSTVSYALRNNPNIAEATRIRVQAIAKEMGYRRNAYVSTLMAQVHGKRVSSEQPAIAWIVDRDLMDIFQKQGGFYQRVLEGAKGRAKQLGYFIDDFVWDSARMPISRLGHILKSRGIRGVVFAPVSSEHYDFTDFPFSEFACSSIGYSLKSPKLHRVGIDFSQGIELIWSKVQERGFRVPGLIMTKPYDERTGYVSRGVFMALPRGRKIKKIPPCLMVRHEMLQDFEKRKIQSWLEEHLPDVIICCVSPREVFELVKRIQVPYNPTLFVINQDKASPESGIVQPDIEVGRMAVDIVVNQIHRSEQGIPETPSTTLIPYKWIESSAREV